MELEQEYGKENVRLVKVIREKDQHYMVELKVKVVLSGAKFLTSYTEGDNTKVVATDSIKNIIYVTANSSNNVTCIEKLGLELATLFLTKYNDTVERVKVVIDRVSWKRLVFPNREHKHAFQKGDRGNNRTTVIATNSNIDIGSQVSDFHLLKTTGSSFTNFLRDEYTTLPEMEDRILSTSVDLNWNYNFKSLKEASDYPTFCSDRSKHLDLAIEEFVNPISPSVQATIYKTCAKILKLTNKVYKVTMALPNNHVFKVDLPVFKGQFVKPTDLYAPTLHPNGIIQATIMRKDFKL